MKQLLKLAGAFIFFVVALATPILTYYQQFTSHQQKDALVTQIESHQSKGRRGRVSTYYNLHYAYEINGIPYTGFDPNYQATGSTRPGDSVRILYHRDRPMESRIAESGGQHWTQTLVLLAISAYLFFSFYRHRR